MTGSEKPIIILLDNVLTTSAFALETKDGDEAAIDYEGTANTSFEQLQNDEFPWTILYPTDETVAVTGVTLNKTTLSLAVGANETLTATVLPANATDKSGTYSSDDSTIATVNAQGKVVGVKAGTTNVKFTTSNGKTATCAVTVA